MKFQTRNRHVIDFAFPIALLFVFAASAFAALILAADVYGQTTGRLRVNDESRSALSYISEKIRQNDAGGALRIARTEERDCLAISAGYGGVSCTTYIYEYEGMLKELFIRDGVPFSLKDGKNMMEIASLSMERLEEHLYQLVVTDSKGAQSSMIVSERSVP